MTAVLDAVGPRLQRLSLIEEGYCDTCESLNDLIPAIVIHCPLLARLAVEHLGLGKTASVSVMGLCCICMLVGRHIKQCAAQDAA